MEKVYGTPGSSRCSDGAQSPFLGEAKRTPHAATERRDYSAFFSFGKRLGE